MSDLDLADPFPSVPAPIIPVDEEDVEDPDTGLVHAVSEQDSRAGEKMARQKLRATSQKIRQIERSMTPTGTPATKKE